MAKNTETSKSSSKKSDVIQVPTTGRGTKKIPVDTSQAYDDSSEPKGLGEAGFKEPGDPVVRTARHQARVDDK